METISRHRSVSAWQVFEENYRPVKEVVDGFVGDATLIGIQLIQDVPTRVEYMKMIRSEANDMLAMARKHRVAARIIFDRIYDRRNELRLVAQNRAQATVNILSKLMTKNRSKYDTLVSAADDLARKNRLPSVRVGDKVKSIPLEQLSPEQIDDVFIHAIDRAGGSRTTVTPMKMRMRGAGLLFLTVALAGLDIYMSNDKSFAVSKNVASVAGGAGGAWAFAAAGLAVGGPVGGVIGLIVGGIVGSYVAEEAHFQVRGLHSDPRVDQLVNRHHGIINFDEEALAVSLHTEFLADVELIYIAFAHLNEKRNSDADDVACAYLEIAKIIVRTHPQGGLVDAFRTQLGVALLDLLYNILDSGWTTSQEYDLMNWLSIVKQPALENP